MTGEEKLGTESLWKLMFSMGIPTFIGQLVNILYNVVDRVFIGHIPDVGANALTGVGLCLPIITLIAAFSQFAGAGGAPRAAIALGRGDRERAEKILANSFTMLLSFAVVLTAVFFLVKKPFLYAFGASDSTYPYASAYIDIYLCGTLFVMLVMGLNTFITAQGRSGVAMVSVLVGAVTNIVLDPVFIFVFGLGVKGAAYATVLSQALSAAWILRFLCSGRASLRIKFDKMAPDRAVIGSIAALGVSPFIMSATESLISIVFNSGAARYGGDLYVGSVTILQSVNQMVMIPMNGFALGVQPVISYNFGAGKKERVRTVCRRLIAICFVYSLVFSLLGVLMPAAVAGIFTNDAELLSVCAKVLPIYLAGFFVFGLQCGSQTSFMALGQAKISLFFALLRKVILLTPLALILPRVTGSVISLFVAEPVSDAVSAVTCFLTFSFSLNKILERGK